jgi:hypothetical protein
VLENEVVLEKKMWGICGVQNKKMVFGPGV